MRPTSALRFASTALRAGDAAAAKPRLPTLEAYRYFAPYQTRWLDNDQYGHVNNVASLLYCDSIVNEYLINHGGLDPKNSAHPTGLVISAQYTYSAAYSYPSPIILGLSVAKLGRSSVTYNVGIFEAKDQTSSIGRGGFGSEGKCEVDVGVEGGVCVYGGFTHVFVKRGTKETVTIEGRMREALEKLLVKPPSS